MGIARTGAVAGNGSGDIFIEFSTANPGAAEAKGLPALMMLPNERITPLFSGTVHATEEAIINALVAARTTEGFAGHRAIELPHDRLPRAAPCRSSPCRSRRSGIFVEPQHSVSRGELHVPAWLKIRLDLNRSVVLPNRLRSRRASEPPQAAPPNSRLTA
jgi:hypothetical protein